MQMGIWDSWCVHRFSPTMFLVTKFLYLEQIISPSLVWRRIWYETGKFYTPTTTISKYQIHIFIYMEEKGGGGGASIIMYYVRSFQWFIVSQLQVLLSTVSIYFKVIFENLVQGFDIFSWNCLKGFKSSEIKKNVSLQAHSAYDNFTKILTTQ